MTIEDDLRPGYASLMDVETYRLLRLDQHGPKAVNGHSNSDIEASINHEGDAVYRPCPEAISSSDIPTGKILSIRDWPSDRYANTLWHIWIYLPADLPVGTSDMGLIQLNDGHIYLEKTGPARAASVLDFLHAAGEISPTIGVFVMPGRPMNVNPDWDDRS